MLKITWFKISNNDSEGLIYTLSQDSAQLMNPPPTKYLQRASSCQITEHCSFPTAIAHSWTKWGFASTTALAAVCQFYNIFKSEIHIVDFLNCTWQSGQVFDSGGAWAATRAKRVAAIFIFDDFLLFRLRLGESFVWENFACIIWRLSEGQFSQNLWSLNIGNWVHVCSYPNSFDGY